jgi:hypothetical protein
MATKKTTGKQLADLMYGGDQMRATPQSRITGPVANAVRKAQQFASQYELDPRIPLLGGTGVDELLSLPEAASLLEDVSYNGMGALIRGGNAATGGLGTFRPDPRIVSAADVAATATGVGQLGALAARAAPGAVRAGVRNLSTPSTLNPQAGVMKLKGGNWLGGNLMGNIDRSVSGLKPYRDPEKALEVAEAALRRHEGDPRMQHAVEPQRRVVDDYKKKVALNNWVTNNLGKYTKNQMATPEDPIRLLLDKRTKEIEAKHAKDMERADRVAQRAMDEPDPRRQANMIRESERLKMEANVERQFAMDSIIPSRMQDYGPDADYYLKQRRQEAGFPAEGMGESEAARRYETLTDDAISSERAGDLQAALANQPAFYAVRDQLASHTNELKAAYKKRLQDSGLSPEEVDALDRKTPLPEKAYTVGDERYQQLMDEFKRLSGSYTGKDLDAAKQNPFISKLDPETQLYSGNTADMGFDHVIDILKQDVASGRIRPEQLNKVSVEDAVRRTMEFDQEAARKMAEAQIKATEGFPTYKEYPEGYRWIELTKPELGDELPSAYQIEAYESKVLGPMHRIVNTETGMKGEGYKTPERALDEFRKTYGEDQLADALKYEGDTMGHCVGGYCPDVLEGKSRIYSLRDAKGEPHVTVEVEPNQYLDYNKWYGEQPTSYKALLNAKKSEPGYDPYQEPAYLAARDAMPPKIVQIKGKQNARPVEKYDKYTQDFVKSGTYSDVGDLENTGLRRTSDVFNETEQAFLRNKGVELMPYIEPEETARYQQMFTRNPSQDFEDGMARGGPVHFSDNPDVMQLELAGGGAVRMQAGGIPKRLIDAGAKAFKALKPAKVEKELALPPVLPRAPAKTKEEIRPYAQRMAQQMTGEFYRPNPKKSENVAGKSFSQFKMEKGLDHDIRPTREVVEPEVADIEKQLGMLKIGISGDTTIADKVLHRAGPYELFDPSPQHGGPRYGLGGEGAWASNNPIAATVQKRVNELSEAYGAPPLGQYMAMGPQGSNFAQHFADANLQAIDTSAMTKAQIEQINKLIREGSQKSGPRPSFPGIEDRGSAYLHFAIDPELRKHFNDLMQKTSVTEKLNLPDGRIILHAITEPELRDKEILNTGFSQMRLKSAFDPESLQISAHPTYSHVIPHEEGSAVTRTKYLTPGELEFSDVLDYAKQHYRPQDMTRVFQTSTPRQIVDPQHIDEMKMYEELMKEYTGKKKGGEVKAPAAQIDGEQFVLAARRYGLGDDMTTLNKIVNLVNRGATVDEAAQIVAMTIRQNEQQVQGYMQPQEKSEQRVQNPVHFTENPDAMRLELTQRN